MNLLAVSFTNLTVTDSHFATDIQHKKKKLFTNKLLADSLTSNAAITRGNCVSPSNSSVQRYAILYWRGEQAD